MNPFMNPNTEDVYGKHYNVVRILNATSKTFILKNPNYPQVEYKPDFSKFFLRPILSSTHDKKTDIVASSTVCLPILSYTHFFDYDNTFQWFKLLESNKVNAEKISLLVDHTTLLNAPEDIKPCLLCPLLTNMTLFKNTYNTDEEKEYEIVVSAFVRFYNEK
jgi:hypothetical protein